MNLSDGEFENIQAYLDGKLSRDEEKRFLSIAKKNSTLTTHLDFENELYEHLLLTEVDNNFIRFGLSKADFNVAHNAESGKIIADLKEKHKKAKIINITRKPVYYLSAASVIIIVAVCSVIYFTRIQPKKPVLADEKNGPGKNSLSNQPNNYSPLKLNESISYPALAGGYYEKDSLITTVPYILQQQFAGYATGNYTAIQQLNINNLPATTNTEEDNYVKTIAYYYKGLSYIETSDLNNAVINLTEAIKMNPNTQISIKASWYLALNYLMLKNASAALPLLNTVKNNTAYPVLARHAVELLGKIVAK